MTESYRVPAPWQNLSLSQESIDFFRPTKYRVTIAPPRSVRVDSRTLERICQNCCGATIPELVVGSKSVDYGGSVPRSVPHSVAYDDELELTFYLSSDFAERRFFEEWQRSIVAEETTQRLAWYSDYASAIVEVTALDFQNRTTDQTYLFYEAYPKLSGKVELAYDKVDEVSTIRVPMKFYKFERRQN